MTIGELARKTGVTIRTLRHYDRIGLLPPAEVTDAGYRIYDEHSVRRLYAILVFRELEMPLSQIRRLLDGPREDWPQVLRIQQELLTMRRQHIDGLIALTASLQEKGMNDMDFSIFSDHQEKDYAAQAEAAWGQTAAWQEYAQRESKRPAGQSREHGQALMEMIGQFGRSRPERPEAPEAQAFVRQLQAYISAHFYTCTTPVLAGLADTYETDAFRKNIDKAGGEGTAAFLAQAIRAYCRQG